jgi:hypothetical protein
VDIGEAEVTDDNEETVSEATENVSFKYSLVSFNFKYIYNLYKDRN